MKYIFILLIVLLVGCKTRKAVTSDKTETTAKAETKTESRIILQNDIVSTAKAGVLEQKTEKVTDTTTSTETTIFGYDTARGKAYIKEVRKTENKRRFETAQTNKADTGATVTNDKSKTETAAKTEDKKAETTFTEAKRKDVDRKINPFVIGGSIVLLIIAFIFVYRRLT